VDTEFHSVFTIHRLQFSHLIMIIKLQHKKINLKNLIKGRKLPIALSIRLAKRERLALARLAILYMTVHTAKKRFF
jgi:hypothetical protein